MRGLSKLWITALALEAHTIAAGLPAWTDDSGMVLRIEPARTVWRDSAKLTTSVFHSIDVITNAQYTFTIQDDQGTALRVLYGAATFRPGDAMEFSIDWDRRTDNGILLSYGKFTAVVTVELKADPSAAANPGSQGEERVEKIVQTRSSTLEFFPTVPSKASVIRQAQFGQDPAFPFNHYYGTLHTQTNYSDRGHPNDANCASSTLHQAGDFTPAQAYSYARNTAHLDFLGISDHNHLFNDACSGCTAAQIVQRYHDGLAAAASANTDGSFVAIYG